MQRKFIWLTTFLFLLTGIFLLLHHEMWRDELQTWLLATDSHSLKELYQNTRYEEHPMLWFVFVYLISLFSNNPESIQWLHLFIATSTVFLFLKYSPFKPFQKILFVFGYFTAYEYSIISRNYAIGLFLLVAVLSLISSQKKSRLPIISFLLFLLMQTNFYGILMAMPLFLFLIWENDLVKPKSKRGFAVFILVFLAGLALSVITLIPPADTWFITGWRFHVSPFMIKKTFGIIWSSFVPIPKFQIAFWNTNFLDDTLSDVLQFIGGIFILIWCSLILLPRRKVLLLYLSLVLLILSFSYFRFFGYQRHHGHLFIFFIACLWISKLLTTQETPINHRFLRIPYQYKDVFITSILSIHVLAFIMAAYFDAKYPFSSHQYAANYISQNHLENLPIIGDRDGPASAVAASLNKEFYYPMANRWGKHVIFNNKRDILPDEAIVKSAEEVADQNHSEALMVFSHPIDRPYQRVEWMAEFKPSIVEDEEYYIYRIKKKAIDN